MIRRVIYKLTARQASMLSMIDDWCGAQSPLCSVNSTCIFSLLFHSLFPHPPFHKLPPTTSYVFYLSTVHSMPRVPSHTT